MDQKVASMSQDTNGAGASETWVVPEFPRRVLMDLRTDCNLKCPMCIVHGSTEDPKLKAFLRRSVPLDKAKKVLDEVMAARPMLQPNLWSEPLLAKDLRPYLQSAKERGLAVAINTNGLLLREELARFLVDIKLDSISISIDATTVETLDKVRGITKLEKIHNAVALMIRVRGENPLPRIGVSFTVQDTNKHERDSFVAYWADKVDFVRIGELFVDGRFPGMKVDGERRPCPSLYTTLALHVNGNASICCLDGFGETNVGNVFERGVADVWHGPELTEIRQHHENGEWDKVPFCKSCDRWASYDYEEAIEGEFLVRRSLEYTYYNRIDRLKNWTPDLVVDADAMASVRELAAE